MRSRAGTRLASRQRRRSQTRLQIFYCGGIALVNNEDTTTTDACAVYDPAADEWLQGAIVPPPMPAGRNHAAACTDGARLFVFGGRDEDLSVSPAFAETQVYDPAIGAWAPLAAHAPLPIAIGGTGKGIYYQGRCFVFGGEVQRDSEVGAATGIDPQLFTSYRVDIYDIAADAWTRGAVRGGPTAWALHFLRCCMWFVWKSGQAAASASRIATSIAYCGTATSECMFEMYVFGDSRTSVPRTRRCDHKNPLAQVLQ